jgi:syntaxin-binding protein 1
LITIEEHPLIRYYNPTTNITVADKLAKTIQSELDAYAALDPDFAGLKSKRRASLIIVDRSFDMISPLIHEFTYQAMINDLLALEGGQYV